MSQNKSTEARPLSEKDKVKFADKKNVRVYAATPTTHFVDRTWNVCCLPLLAVLLLGLGVALIIVAAVKQIPDLYLLGAIFLFGSVIFFGLLYLAVCRPSCQKNVVNNYEFEETGVTKQPLKAPEPAFEGYLNANFDDKEDLMQAKSRPIPRDSVLYGADRTRSFLATPATATDVRFDEQGTPPPPRLALPSEPGDSKNAVFTMDIDKEMSKNAKEIGNLELL